MQLSSQARKAMAAGLAASTLLWSAAGILPQIASAAVHSDGCLVLSGGIVWMITGGTRRGYTSAEVFQSYGYNFSQVVTASPEDVALPVGPIMIYADGTLVKGPNDPLVYLVAAGQKRPFVSGAVFTGLGYSFSNIQLAPVNTFSDLPIGTNLDSTTIAHPAGTKVISSGAVWLMDVNGRRGFSSAANYLGYGYKFAQIVQANSADLASANLGDVPSRAACTTGITPPPPPVSGSFSVSMASDNPAGTSIIADATNGGQALVNLAKLNFVGGSAGVTVTSINLRRIGVASDTLVNNAYLYDGNNRLAQMQGISAGVLSFANSTGLFTVTANTIRAITVKFDLVKSATAGQTIGVSINSAADVVATGGVNPTGTFPINGNLSTVAVVTDLGKLTVAHVSDPGTTTTAITGAELWRFSLKADNQNLKITYLALTNVGSINAGDIQNLKLFDGSTQLGATVLQQDSNRMLVFDLSASPIILTAGVTKQYALKGDMLAGSTRTFQYSFQNSSDVQVMDAQYNVPIFPFPSGGTVGTWTVVKATNTTTINAGTLSVSKTSDSPAGNIALSGTSVTLAKYSLTAAGEDMKVTTLTIQANSTGSNKTLKNAKLFIGTGQVGTTTATLTADNGTTTYAYTTNFIVKAGTISYLTVVADTTGTTVDTNTVTVTLNAGSSNAQGITSLSSVNAPSSAIAANTLTVTASALTGALNPSLAAVSIVKGAAAQKIGSVLLTAGAAEGVNLNTLVIVDRNTGDTANAANGLGNAFNNIKLMNGSTQLGATSVSPSTTAGTTISFSFPAVLIPAGQTLQLDIVADVLSGATWTSGDKVKVNGTTTTGTGVITSTSVTLSTTTLTLQGITLNTAGTVTVSLDGSSPANAQQIVMGSTANTLGVWQFSANALENLNVNQIIVNSTSTAGGDYLNLKLMVNGTQVGGTVPALTAASNGTATFGSAAITLFSIPANSFAKVTLVGDVANAINATGATSATFNMQTPASITGVAANQVIVTGQQSGAYAVLANASATYTSQATYTYRTKVIATNVAVPSQTTNTRQANDLVFAMNLAANSAYQVAFRSAVFQSADTATTAFSGALSTAATWTAVNNTHNGVLSTDTTNQLEGAGAQLFTAGTTTAANDGLVDTFAATDLSGYNGIAVWVRETGTLRALTLTLTGAGAGTQTVAAPGALSRWQLYVFPFAGATTPFTGLTAVTAIQVLMNAVASADTFEVDSIYLYKDFVKANVNGLAFLTVGKSIALKDAVSGATFGNTFFNGTAPATCTTACTAGTAYFFPTTEFDVSAGANRNLNLTSDTSGLLNAALSSIAVNVNMGSSASTVSAPGDVLWYDGKVSTSVPWLDSQPNPVQGATRNY